MEKLKSEHIEEMYLNYVRKGLPVIQRGKAGIITKICEGVQKYLLLVFPDKKFTAVPFKHKVGWGELGEYIFTYEQHTSKEKNTLDFARLTLYNTATGEVVKHTEKGQYPLGNVVILNRQLLAICGNKHQPPRFFAVISGELAEIPVTAAESALSLYPLSIPHKQALIEYYPRQGWELHNGIIINPQTFDVPSKLQYLFWKQGRHYKAAAPAKLDTDLLVKMLTRTDKEKPVIKYITL